MLFLQYFRICWSKNATLEVAQEFAVVQPIVFWILVDRVAQSSFRSLTERLQHVKRRTPDDKSSQRR